MAISVPIPYHLSWRVDNIWMVYGPPYPSSYCALYSHCSVSNIQHAVALKLSCSFTPVECFTQGGVWQDRNFSYDISFFFFMACQPPSPAIYGMFISCACVVLWIINKKYYLTVSNLQVLSQTWHWPSWTDNGMWWGWDNKKWDMTVMASNDLS